MELPHLKHCKLATAYQQVHFEGIVSILLHHYPSHNKLAQTFVLHQDSFPWYVDGCILHPDIQSKILREHARLPMRLMYSHIRYVHLSPIHAELSFLSWSSVFLLDISYTKW